MLSARLQMRQSQSLVLTPQLLQSIRLLQFSAPELDAFVDAEIERNPLLERGAEPSPSDPAFEAFDGAGAAADAGEGPQGALDVPGSGEDAFREDPDVSVPGSRLDGLSPGPTPVSGGASPPDQDQWAANENPSLARHVLSEIADILLDPLEARIGEALAGYLNDAGYLERPVDEIAAAIGIDERRVSLVLDRLTDAIEPAGLFARSLADCLAIQLRRRNRLDPVIQTVLDHLELLGKRDFGTLRRLTGEDEAGLLDILAEIRRLDPKPGHGFEHGTGGSLVPDVVVDVGPDGAWRVELNPAALPRVLVNERYAATLSPERLGKEDGGFLADCQSSANWLVRSLDQRARTILKVASEIVRRQDEFLVNGIAALRPMTLMTVAEAIGMHESTVSRVTSNKYVATPRGTFEMKFFFTVAIAATGGGDAHSAESVKHRIRLLVDGETRSGVLSDDDIAERLKEEGVDLARRTVAKYREALGIPSSIQRRREINARRLAS